MTMGSSVSGCTSLIVAESVRMKRLFVPVRWPAASSLARPEGNPGTFLSTTTLWFVPDGAGLNVAIILLKIPTQGSALWANETEARHPLFLMSSTRPGVCLRDEYVTVALAVRTSVGMMSNLWMCAKPSNQWETWCVPLEVFSMTFWPGPVR
jgi:hypothetical protein